MFNLTLDEIKLQGLENDYEKLRKEISNLKRKIELDKQEKCTGHNFEFFCHSHNGRTYMCTKCGLMEDR